VISRNPRWLTPAALLLAMLLLGGACSRNSDSKATATPEAGVEASATATTVALSHPGTPGTSVGSSATPGTLSGSVATVAELLSDPSGHTGQTVLTHGYVDTVLSDNAVVITDSSQQLLILGVAGAIPKGLTVDEFVEVAGRVELFDAQQAASELDISLDGLDVARFAGESSLVVGAIRAGAVPVGEIVADAASFEGRTIAVGGEISSVIDARAFVMAPAGAEPAASGMLVATPFAAVPAQMATQARVQVVGRVVQLDSATIANLGEPFAFLAGPEFDQYKGKPVFVSDVVVVLASAPTATSQEILSQPDTWEGKTVTVIDTVVARLTDRAVSIGADGGLMVVGGLDQLPATVVPGVTIVVNGAVVRFDPSSPPDIAGFDPAHPAVAAFAGKPIIVVTSVQVLPGS